METSWYGLFDLDPDDSLEVRAGDLQEFLRQQMMGATNPGLTVATADERKDNLSALAQRLRDCKHREFNDGMDVEYAIEEAIGYTGGSIDGLFDRLADLVGSSEAAQPERDDEVFCTIRWSRADIVDAIENACGVRLDRDVDDPTEAEEVIDRVIDAVQDGLEDRSTELGWEVIDTLMPQDALDRALEIYGKRRDMAGRNLSQQAEKNSAQRSYRSAVVDALEKEGWKVQGDDTGSFFSLTYRTPDTGREFALLLDMRGKDANVPASWIKATELAVKDDIVLWYGGIKKNNQSFVRYDIDRFRDGMRRNLPMVVKNAVMSVEPRGYDNNLVRDWFVRNYPEDELGSQINPTLTFEEAMRATSRGSGFYDVLGVGDSIVRNLVFEEMAARSGHSYADIYEAWMNGRPVPGYGLLETVYGPGVYDELDSARGEQEGVSLKSEAESSRQASEQLSGRSAYKGHDQQDKPSPSNEIR